MTLSKAEFAGSRPIERVVDVPVTLDHAGTVLNWRIEGRGRKGCVAVREDSFAVAIESRSKRYSP